MLREVSDGMVGEESDEVSDKVEWMRTVYQGWHVERMDEDCLSRMACGENG